MTKYRYTGPFTGVTLGGGLSVQLVSGLEVSLDEKNAYVARLVARGLLTPVAKSSPPIEPMPTQDPELSGKKSRKES